MRLDFESACVLNLPLNLNLKIKKLKTHDTGTNIEWYRVVI